MNEVRYCGAWLALAPADKRTAGQCSGNRANNTYFGDGSGENISMLPFSSGDSR